MSTVYGSILVGVDVVSLRIEAVSSPGFSGLHLLGLPSEWARDARERVRVALEACGQRLDDRKVVVQVSCERSLRLTRSATSLLDFPLCAAVLLALAEHKNGKEPSLAELHAAQPLHLVGEIHLSGALGAGVSTLFCEAAAQCAPTHHRVCLPAFTETVSMPARARSFSCLPDFAAWLAGGESDAQREANRPAQQACAKSEDDEGQARTFLQEHLRVVFPCVLDSWMRTPKLGLALTLAMAGRLHLFVLGSPGIGKTHALTLARELLPPLSSREGVERRLICMGTRADEDSRRRPIRSPQHTCSVAGLVGNAHLAPGEFTLAHRGVLLLDELLEFGRDKLEALREPLEGKRVHLARAQGSIDLPADFQLLAAANPCRCGHFFSQARPCRCLPRDRARAWAPLSGPLLDRFHLKIALGDASEERAADPYTEALQELSSTPLLMDAFLERLTSAILTSYGFAAANKTLERSPASGSEGEADFARQSLSSLQGHDALLAPNFRARRQWDAVLRTADALFPSIAQRCSTAERLEHLSHLRNLENVLEHVLLYDVLPLKDLKSRPETSIPRRASAGAVGPRMPDLRLTGG